MGARQSNRNGVFRKRQPSLLKRCGHQQHAVARFGCAAALAGHDDQRLVKRACQTTQHAGDAVGIGVVDELHAHAVGSVAERIGHEHGPQRRTADPDGKNLRKLARRVYLRRERNDGVPRRIDLSGQFRSRRQLGGAQPIVPHHALFVGIRNSAFFKLVHGLKRALDGRLHALEVRAVEVHPADVDA